ncbi:MAG: acyl-CoA thioesterase II [Dehalococcoidia bacterium]
MDIEHAPLGTLLGLLELERLDRDLFLGSPGPGEDRLFGGMVAAQAVIAGGRTVDEGTIHSLHAYFVRPGSHTAPIRYVVDRIRDGRTFTTRHVVAYQSGEAIFDVSLSFARAEDGIEHQDAMPDVPGPEGLEDFEAVMARLVGPEAAGPPGPIDVRDVDPEADFDGQPHPPRKAVWVRPRGAMPEDGLIHAALMVYASDHSLIDTASLPHPMPWTEMMAASLDHAVWFHRPTLFGDWLLYASESPAAYAARGLTFGAMYTRAGIRVATVAQEGLIRGPRRAEAAG